MLNIFTLITKILDFADILIFTNFVTESLRCFKPIGVQDEYIV